MVPGRGVQGGEHARGDGLSPLLSHRPTLRAPRRLPQGHRAAHAHMVGGGGQASKGGKACRLAGLVGGLGQ